MHRTPALQNTTAPAPRNPESGVAVIMVLIILLLMAVLSLGFMVSVRNMSSAADSMFRHSMTDNAAFSGQMHAIAALRRNFANDTTKADGSQEWQSLFAGDEALHIWHGVRGARVSQSDKFYGGGLAPYRDLPDSPMDIHATGYNPQIHDAHEIFNDKFLTHDGTGKWFNTGYYDRNCDPVSSPNDARYIARYAVGVIDLSGRILVNPLPEVRDNPGYMTTMTAPTQTRYEYRTSPYKLAVEEFKKEEVPEGGDPVEVTRYRGRVESDDEFSTSRHISMQPNQSKASLVAHFFYQSLDDTPWNHDTNTISEGLAWDQTRHRTNPLSDPLDRVEGNLLAYYGAKIRRMSKRFDTVLADADDDVDDDDADDYAFDLYNWHQIHAAHSQHRETNSAGQARGRLGKTDTFWDTTYLFTPFGGAFAADGFKNANIGSPNPIQWTINVNSAPRVVLEAAIVAMDEIISFEERHYKQPDGTNYTWVQIHGYEDEDKNLFLEPTEEAASDPRKWRPVTINDTAVADELGWMKKIREYPNPKAKLKELTDDLEKLENPTNDPRIAALLNGTHFIRVQEMKSRFFRVAVHAQFFDKLQGPLAEKRVDFVYVLAPQRGNAATPGDIKGSHILYYHVADDPRILR